MCLHRTISHKAVIFTLATVRTGNLTTSHKVSRLLAKFNIKTVHILAKSSQHLLRPIKDDLGLKVSGDYGITYECGKMYSKSSMLSELMFFHYYMDIILISRLHTMSG
jgi:23S rRNA pseudoU1915 N3-methylase RlmH